MSAAPDPDSQLRAWLDLMPDEAPDRAIAAVLQAVVTTPQVRKPLRWLPRRALPMNRSSYAIGAAAVVVVVAGALLLTRPTTPDVGGSPKPTVTAVPSATPPGAAELPPELRARWMGGERVVPGILPAAGTMLNFTEQGTFFITQSNQNEDHYLPALASSEGIGQFRLESTTGDGSCANGDTGIYSWSVSPSGRILTISAELDDCATRLGAVPGVWWLEACKNTVTNCLGEMDAGTYKSQYVAPRIDPGAPWEPNFGALTFTVPAGWAHVDDFPESFGLMLSSDYAGWPENDEVGMLFVSAQPRAFSQASPCSRAVDPTVGRTAGDLVAWLHELPGLLVTDAGSITIDGRPGTVIDIRIDPTWTTGCDGSTPEILYMTPEVGIFGLEARIRLIFVDLGDGDVLGIGMFAPAAKFDTFVAVATPVAETFDIE